MANLKTEYPTPQFQRDRWVNLNGEWDFAFDDNNIGIKEKWYKDFPKKMKINVPFAYQTENSGIHDPSFHDTVWYRRSFDIDTDWKGEHILLHFGAVDYHAAVYVNGQLVKQHEGGHTPFYVDITNFVEVTDNELVIRVEDPSEDVTIPRGKQYWHEKSASIFYTRTTGIWQTVWLEPVPATRIKTIRWTPDIDEGNVDLEAELANLSLVNQAQLQVDIYFNEKKIVSDTFEIMEDYLKRSINIRNRFTDRSNIHGPGWYWSPEHPNLFDVQLTLLNDGQSEDIVHSYFGMRKVSIENGKFMLNNKAYYQKLILDQGYFREGLLTAPSDQALKEDILLSKEMGFNGARKHQKIEDPRFLYWADKLGFLVWGEMANCSEYSEDAVRRISKEWADAVTRDYSHPSVVAWVPLNESWGISRVAHDKQQQDHSLAMYYLTKSLDQTRPVISNDGWEHTKSDLCTIHNYNDPSKIQEQYKDVKTAIQAEPANRSIYANGFEYNGEPILITEYGGIAYKVDNTDGWGYSAVESGEQLIEEYAKVTNAIAESPVIHGFCYTQLTDVEQEINGLLTYDRKPKCDLKQIKAINDRIK
ncbi:sugar-binding domain-containing protein [Gracilibacillus sp. YIM 98692]|uniref:glycoside hydrolase family 2 protein n=1 Tax=Gracilibacillus sp. YIM 98692 TaxID=2663532 RepID=UPI0013D32CE5|nr:sugar-binding domain-containing protein [Gracilibacillus sp. YIM 98692]